MKSQKAVTMSQQLLKGNFNKKATVPSYGNIIKIPAAAPYSSISEEIKTRLYALTDNAGSSIVENRMPLRVLLSGALSDINENVPLLLSTLYKKDIYRIDLSHVISKYAGETEKNLDDIFKRAEEKDWILFFDEADALFGKRSQVDDAHDKYANQENVETGCYLSLLQRLENYSGILLIKCSSPECLRISSLAHFKAFG
ncbi:MAG: AAA family ATPase [Ginsengibacter sp.]